MSQHSQLLAGSGFVPADGQHGDVMAGPTRFTPPLRSRPRGVVTIGVEPGSYLRRAILWRSFGVANVGSTPEAEFLAQEPGADTVIIHTLTSPPTWEQLLAWAGKRSVIVDIQIAASMAAAGGDDLRVHMASGEATPALEVMCHQENRLVYPNAPAVEIVAEPPVPTGMAIGDRVHFYAPSAIDMGLRALDDNDALRAFTARFGTLIWGRASQTQGAALLSCPTPAGGLVTIMDLHTVDRAPEPSGSETPGVQMLLSLLGVSPVTFGRFVVPQVRYGDYIDALQELVQRYPRFASMETIGRSVGGRDLWLLRIARDPEAPVVLLSNVVHPYEWAPIYGVWRYLRYLLEQLEQGGWETEELLGDRQLWWIPSVCPDGFDDRRQQSTAINLNRNFPGGWEHAARGQLNWGSFGAPNSIEEIAPISLRGPGPGSQPETQALMSLFHRGGPPIVTLADFHENHLTNNFLHQREDHRGEIADMAYHTELLEGICHAFAGRFYEQRDRAFYKVDHATEFSPGRVCGWLGYAAMQGAKGCVVEAAGGDCTHYRTVRRTEYAAQVVEQVLAAEHGRLYRNPWGESQEITMRLARGPQRLTIRIYDMDGRLVETEVLDSSPASITRTVPPGGCLRLRFEKNAV